MIEALVIEHGSKGSIGRGRFLFLHPPRVGEVIELPSMTPELEYYSVTTVEHHPVLIDAERPQAARPTPTLTLFVRFSHEYEPDEP